MTNVIGPSYDEVHHELIADDPEYGAIFEEISFTDNLAFELAELRHERHFSQRALAKIARVSQPMIARIEKGAQVPTATTLFKLATVLQAKIEITPDGATVTQYERPQQVYFPILVPTVYKSASAMSTGTAYMPFAETAETVWSDLGVNWAALSTGQVVNQARPGSNTPQGANLGSVVDAWLRSIDVNQESVREPVSERTMTPIANERAVA